MVNTERLCMGCMNDNGGEKICPICGHNNSQDNGQEFLSVGTWLNANRYLVGKAIESGADGVTYIGWDNDLNSVVNIREYFPENIAVRSGDRMTVFAADQKGYAFNKGTREFVELYTALSKFPSISALLQVVDVFEANGTVYSVSNTVSGITLKAFLLRNGGVLKWEQVRPLFMPVLSTLAELHNNGIVHRAISPETIIVGRDGRLRLTGFFIKDARMEHTEFASQLYTGYAAPEQYGYDNKDSDVTSDIYSIGAVIFRCLIGTTPPDSKERIISDHMSIPAKITETVPKAILSTMANAMKIDPDLRTPSAEHLKSVFESVAISATTDVDNSKEQTPEKKTRKINDSKRYAIIASSITAGVFVIIMAVIMIAFGGSIFGNKQKEEAPTSSVEPPVVSKVGDVDADVSADPDVKKYSVPDYKGNTYAQVMHTPELSEKFDIVIAGKKYSDSVERGQICDQTVEAGTQVIKDTEVGVYISLGPSAIPMPDIMGKTQQETYIMLLEYGFLPTNIEFIEKYDESSTPKAVLSFSLETGTPLKAGDNVSLDDALVIYVNSFEGTNTSSDN